MDLDQCQVIEARLGLKQQVMELKLQAVDVEDDGQGMLLVWFREHPYGVGLRLWIGVGRTYVGFVRRDGQGSPAVTATCSAEKYDRENWRREFSSSRALGEELLRLEKRLVVGDRLVDVNRIAVDSRNKDELYSLAYDGVQTVFRVRDFLYAHVSDALEEAVASLPASVMCAVSVSCIYRPKNVH